jgi:hypothetical protein
VSVWPGTFTSPPARSTAALAACFMMTWMPRRRPLMPWPSHVTWGTASYPAGRTLRSSGGSRPSQRSSGSGSYSGGAAACSVALGRVEGWVAMPERHWV